MFDVVERYWDDAPVDIQAIIRELGIEYSEEPMPDDESGRIEAVDGGYRIVVNMFHANTRQRFTAAHELGHYTYHRDLIGDGVSDSALYRCDNFHLRYHNTNIKSHHETEANRFASITLMPMRLIVKLREQYGLQDDTKANISRLAKLLAVSEQALRIRLRLT